MAAPAGVSDQGLDDRIYRLHKLIVDPGMRQVLEEATQLCSDGRQMEAAALVEKVEAISSFASHHEAVPRESAPGTPAPEQSLAARVAADMASGLTNVMVRAIQDLERHISTESARLNSTVGERLDKLQSSVESLQPIHDRLDHLVLAGVTAQERFDELIATTASLREAHDRLDTEMTALRQQMDQLSVSTSSSVDEVCRRIDGQDREIATMNSGLSELASKVAVAAERLERHASAIRTIHESHQERAAMLGQVGELLDRLRNAPVSSQAVELNSL